MEKTVLLALRISKGTGAKNALSGLFMVVAAVIIGSVIGFGSLYKKDVYTMCE